MERKLITVLGTVLNSGIQQRINLAFQEIVQQRRQTAKNADYKKIHSQS